MQNCTIKNYCGFPLVRMNTGTGKHDRTGLTGTRMEMNNVDVTGIV